MSAYRVQLRRTKGYRRPAGTINAQRPSKLGNPHRLPPGADEADRLFVVLQYALDLARGALPVTIDEIREECADRPIGCSCPLDQVCHVDVIVSVANGGDALGALERVA